MNEQAWIVLLTAVVVGLIAMAVTFTKIKKSMTDEGCRVRISKILSSFGAKRGFRTFDNVTLSDGTNSYTADHVMLGDFGVIVFADVNIGQIIYGEPKAETWKVNDNDVAIFIPNPLLELESFTKLLRLSFSKNEIYNVPVSPVVVFAQRFTQPELLLGNVPHAMAQDVKKFIMQNKLTAKPLELDQEKLVNAMKQAQKTEN